ncbi:MAG: hypothetical protein WDN48_14650 [Pseudolabrys sp.]
MPVKVVTTCSRTAKDAVGASEGDSQTQRFVYRVTGVIDPPIDTNLPQVKQLQTTLQNSFADDIIGEYIGRLQNDYGVSINQTALEPGHRRRPANTNAPR